MLRRLLSRSSSLISERGDCEGVLRAIPISVFITAGAAGHWYLALYLTLYR